MVWCCKALLLSGNKQTVHSWRPPFMLATNIMTRLCMIKPDCLGSLSVTGSKTAALLDMHWLRRQNKLCLFSSAVVGCAHRTCCCASVAAACCMTSLLSVHLKGWLLNTALLLLLLLPLPLQLLPLLLCLILLELLHLCLLLQLLCMLLCLLLLLLLLLLLQMLLMSHLLLDSALLFCLLLLVL